MGKSVGLSDCCSTIVVCCFSVALACVRWGVGHECLYVLYLVESNGHLFSDKDGLQSLAAHQRARVCECSREVVVDIYVRIIDL